MTPNERAAITAWNDDQNRVFEKWRTEYLALKLKYHELDGVAYRNTIEFIQEVARCTKTTAEERAADLEKIVRFHQASGRIQALMEFVVDF